ncbi:MAG: hypothetical protein GQ582_08210, partial [Methyloprofundus sp.]|nr:hypothetical protein [Methyloprofundus sp.]
AVENNASYDNSGLLMIKEIRINGQSFRASLQNLGDFKFKVQSLEPSNATLQNPAYYDPELETAVLSRLDFEASHFSIRLKHIGKEIFQLEKDRITQLPTILDQGWDETTRAEFYQTTQGSRVIPYDWFLHLEQAQGQQKLKDPKNMRRMGLLVDEPSDTNPDQLAVGLAKDTHLTRGDSVGITCAFCHTGQLEYQGKIIRIDGGQSFADIEAFQGGILNALEATLANPPKLKRFTDNIVSPLANEETLTQLLTDMEKYRDNLQGRITRSAGDTPHGPSRTDAFTIIGNEVSCFLLDIPENCTLANAPVQFPFLWNTPDFEWVQYNASVHSAIGRNVGEVTGVFAESEIELTNAGPSIISTADIPSIFRLEEILKQLKSPTWPEEIFGAIDTELANQGDVIFAEACASCHTEDPQPRTEPNVFGTTFAKVNFETPLSELQTDPTAALSFATRRAFPGALEPIAAAEGVIGEDGKVPVPTLLNISGRLILGRFIALEQLTEPEIYELTGYRESRSPTVAQLTTYKARPLNGASMTAPFLHNGSVASMYELLLPVAERLTSFHVGNYQFDPIKLGYSTQPTESSMLFDTTVTGNSNSGHLFGTDLNDEERMALIEYMKTL